MNMDITKQMEMVLYRTEDDSVTVSALIKDESIWISQKAMAELFGIDKSGISRHLAKIFETGELKDPSQEMPNIPEAPLRPPPSHSPPSPQKQPL